MPVTSGVRVGCSWVEYQWTEYWKACMLLRPSCVGVGGVCGVLAVAAWCWASASTHGKNQVSACSWCVGKWCVVVCGLHGLACCWVLRQQASLPGKRFTGFLSFWGGGCGAWGLRGSWCFGVCPVFAADALLVWGAGAGVRGCCLGTV